MIKQRNRATKQTVELKWNHQHGPNRKVDLSQTILMVTSNKNGLFQRSKNGLSVLTFILFLRDCTRASGGGAEREGNRGSEAGSVLAESREPHVGLKPTNGEIRT